MTGDQLERWRSALKLSQSKAAKALDIHRNTYGNMERGAVPVDRRTELACMALAARLHLAKWPWE